MGLQSVPAYIGSVGYQHPALLDRNILKTSGGRKPGVVDEADFLPVPTTGLNVLIPPGAAFVPGKDQTNQGYYYAWSDANDTVPCIAPAASNRIDALLLRTVDTTYSAGYTNGAIWEFVAGTPGSGLAPTDADLIAGGIYKPGGWLRVANVQINVGDTVVNPARIFDQRIWTTNANGSILCRAAARPATNLTRGDRIYEVDTQRRYVWNGTTWEFDGNPLWAKLAADATAKVSNTTFSNITGLAFDLEANSTYKFKIFIVYTAASTGGRLKVGSTTPAGTTGMVNFGGPETNNADGTLWWPSLKIPNTNLNDWGIVGGAGTANQIVAHCEGWITTAGTAGTWQLQYAQGQSSATATQVKAGTHGKLTKVA
jgi:hypothetical protein